MVTPTPHSSMASKSKLQTEDHSSGYSNRETVHGGIVTVCASKEDTMH
jgi:hypothetical protein